MRLATAVPAVAMLLVTAGWQPAWGGHGTIEETDDQIIVEYSGDAGDNAAASRGANPSAANPAALPGTVNAQPSSTPPGSTPEASAGNGSGDESPRRLPRNRNTRRPRSGGGAVPMPSVDE
ncbi:hypothetical protein L4X63_19490 [Geomonas sp. Red32]|uniref:hypothetical protein n=1 Tax=Geomonas sp. Red32 TaxID=2912856 RepID=UPI00202CD3FE|nr:hypothetical protein [Geomonas sp. Red32]MCM0083775.1 hypothetical protein [Geomonas sp. Red32]